MQSSSSNLILNQDLSGARPPADAILCEVKPVTIQIPDRLYEAWLWTKRIVCRWRWLKEYEASLNRRAEVETELFDVYSGRRPLPDKDQCRRWAVKLGCPADWRAKKTLVQPLLWDRPSASEIHD